MFLCLTDLIMYILYIETYTLHTLFDNYFSSDSKIIEGLIHMLKKQKDNCGAVTKKKSKLKLSN